MKKAESMQNLDYVFKPESVAFVGATEGKVKWGFVILNNLMAGGYRGRIYPVNPGKETVMGLKCYASVLDIPDEVDMAIFTVPARSVVEALGDCAEKGVKAALVITAGFKELGEEGAELEAEMVRKANAAGMALVGPNGEGVGCPEVNFYPWMPVHYPRAGRISFIAQSGNILNMLIGHALKSGFGVAKAVSSGNEAQLRTEDYFEYFAGDPGTDVIVAYVEGVQDGRRFFEKAREVSASKPIVILKGGRTISGMRAASSHTGAMAVESDIFETACRQAGIITANTIFEAGVGAASFMNRPLPRGRRVGIITGGGGLGVLAADMCTDYGLEVSALSEGLLAEVKKHLPPYFVPGNPIDLVAGLNLQVIIPVVEAVMTSGEVDSVLFIFFESTREKSRKIGDPGGHVVDMGEIWDAAMQRIVEPMQRLYTLGRETGVPLYIAANLDAGGAFLKPGSGNDGLPMVYGEVESACAAISIMARYAEFRDSHPGVRHLDVNSHQGA